jgi:hypothetical protein
MFRVKKDIHKLEDESLKSAGVKSSWKPPSANVSQPGK